jgi:hypothetical protein
MCNMDLTEFHAALESLTPDDIHVVARSLASDTAGDEVDAWHATIAIDRALRHSHRTRHAARAAWDAAQTVQRGAEANGVDLPDVDVTHVARAAAEIARGMTAGDDCAREVRQLLQHWFTVLARARRGALPGLLASKWADDRAGSTPERGYSTGAGGASMCSR